MKPSTILVLLSLCIATTVLNRPCLAQQNCEPILDQFELELHRAHNLKLMSQQTNHEGLVTYALTAAGAAIIRDIVQNRLKTAEAAIIRNFSQLSGVQLERIIARDAVRNGVKGLSWSKSFMRGFGIGTLLQAAWYLFSSPTYTIDDQCALDPALILNLSTAVQKRILNSTRYIDGEKYVMRLEVIKVVAGLKAINDLAECQPELLQNHRE